MIVGMDRLERGAAALRTALPQDRFAIGAGAQQIWSAMIDLDNWPLSLQCRSMTLQMHLVRHGPIADTIRRITDQELAELRQELLEYVSYARHLDNKYRPPQTHHDSPATAAVH